jgi:hypothetical protein
MPAEAKNNKKLIFAEKYDDVFTDQITADSVLTVIRLLNEIEARKMKRKAEILANPQIYDDEAFIIYATHYILYAISELADLQDIEKTQQSYQQLIGLYDKSIELIKKAVEKERASLGIKEKYLHGVFFKSNKPKLQMQKSLNIT